MSDRPSGMRFRDGRIRIAILGTIILSLFSALVLRLYYLQVLTHDDHAQAAEFNRVRVIPIEPTRGKIYDRNGKLLVRNRRSLVVAVRPDVMDDPEGTISRLSALLGIPPEEIKKRLADKTALPYTAIAIAEDVPESTVVYIREHIDQFRGVVDEYRPVRVYPYGPIASHALGYTGEITAEQLEQPRYSERDYRLGSIVGRSGVEYAYEHELRGREGLLKIQVDASGKVRGAPLGDVSAVAGRDLVTTLDIEVQKLVEESLAQGLLNARTIYDKESNKKYLAPAGGAVVLDPRNGEILAMASFPTYDPSVFVGGISRSEFDVLRNDPAKPLLDRVSQAAFPPGSTFKVVTAAAALQEGVASRNGRYACPASFRYSDTTFRNWKETDSGRISLVQALVDSCDTVFYDFGAKFWERYRAKQGERLQDFARVFGFGKKSGIEIPFERGGRVPDESWLKDVHARFPDSFPYSVWLPGYTINMSIGQGDLLTTPLQLANAYAAIANGGNLYEPHLGLSINKGEKPVRSLRFKDADRIPVSRENLDLIKRGLEGVATDGTAKDAFAGWPFGQVPIAAKTGTAELQTIPPKQPYAWFVAYAPARNPQYVVAVMLEEGGHGGETAAPIARRILSGLFGLGLSEIAPAARTD